MLQRLLTLLTAAAFCCCLPIVSAQDELNYSREEFNKLDQFEAHSLGKADKVFHDKDYARAVAEYDAFILEFARSAAVPYALYRKGRCLHHTNKRFNAIRVYTEVLDYFPNAVRYAAASLYYIGLAHMQNGDEEKAMKAWAEMADDEDYSQQPLAADAINRLAAYLVGKDQIAKAMEYYWQVARDFRKNNRDAANQAISRVVAYYIRTKPDVEQLKKFYTEVQGFDGNPQNVPDDLNNDSKFWDKVRHNVRQHGTFNDVQVVQRRSYFGYWASKMDGKFDKWDDYQIELAHFTFYADGDRDKLYARLDEQFTKHQQEGDLDRVVKWMEVYGGNRDKVQEYYEKLTFDKMTNKQIIDVIRVFFDRLKDEQLARNAFDKLKLSEMPDSEKQPFGRWLWHKDAMLLERLCQSYENTDYGKVELLRYFHWRRNSAAGLPLADDLVNSPDYAKEATWKKAEMLFWANRFRDAISSYQQSDNPPESIFGISACYEKLGQLEQAVDQMKQVENFFADQAGSRAALRIAHLYRDAGKQEQYVAALRQVLNKYPAARESSLAHIELEKLGIRTGGGLNVE